MGRGKKPSSSLPRKSGAILNALYGRSSCLFPLPTVPACFLIFDYCYFYWDTQREPRRRREDLRQMPGSSSLRACSPSGGVARSHARPTCECKVRYPSSRLACRNWRAWSLTKFKRRRLHDKTKCQIAQNMSFSLTSVRFVPCEVEPLTLPKNSIHFSSVTINIIMIRFPAYQFFPFRCIKSF